MEDLTKTQLVLLNLFVTFVTSIATGIITVALLQEAPTEITQTINKVVERTIERTVPAAVVKSIAPVPQPTQEDVVTRVVSASAPALLRIYALSLGELVSTSTPLSASDFLGTGFVVSKDGTVVTSSAILPAGDTTYLGETHSGVRVPLLLKISGEHGVAILRAQGDGIHALAPLALFDGTLGLGKTVIAPALGVDVDSVLVGTISGLKPGTASTSPVLQTTISFDAEGRGGPLLDTHGVVIGMATGARSVAHAEVIREVIERLK